MVTSNSMNTGNFLPNTLVFPQVAKRSIHFKGKIKNVAPPRGTWLRTHLWGREREEKSTTPSGNRTHDLKSSAPQECALPLCYNCCPHRRILKAVFITRVNLMIWVLVWKLPGLAEVAHDADGDGEQARRVLHQFEGALLRPRKHRKLQNGRPIVQKYPGIKKWLAKLRRIVSRTKHKGLYFT